MTSDLSAATKPSQRWHTDSRDCSHENDHVCPFCDFDGYYEATYADCPWRIPAPPTTPATEAA